MLWLTNLALVGQLDRSTPPPPVPAPDIEIGKYSSFSLNNGLQVFVVENHKLPVISYHLVFDHDPVMEGDKAGYVSLAGNLVGTATTTLTKDEIDEKMDMIGAKISINASSIYASSLSKHNKRLTLLLSDIVKNSVFNQEEFDKQKKQMLSGLSIEQNDPNSISSIVTPPDFVGLVKIFQLQDS